MYLEASSSRALLRVDVFEAMQSFASKARVNANPAHQLFSISGFGDLARGEAAERSVNTFWDRIGHHCWMGVLTRV